MTESNQGAVGLVVKLPFATPEEFLAKYGANVTRGGIYLRARAVKPPGTAVSLDLRLASGERLIYASAVVHFVTGLKPTEVSVRGVEGSFPNGNVAYMWSAARVVFDNGVRLGVHPLAVAYLGSRVTPERARPGQSVELRHYFVSRRPPPQEVPAAAS